MARVLLIDDEDALRELMAEILRAEGHETLEAATGVAGVEAVRSQRPDLVLCDVNMPQMDGYAVLEAVRSDPQLASMPFLFLTGLGEQHHVRAGMSLGADDYLTKPIAPQDLVAAVDARLARREVSRREVDRRVAELQRSVALMLPHELRTPLTVIIGSGQMIQELHRQMAPEEIAETATAIVKSAERLRRMAENYLLYAGLELQRLAVAEAPARPLLGASGADDVREAAGAQARERGRQQDLELELADATVPVPAPYLRKVVSELVDNAFKFCDAGKPVSVSFRASDARVALAVKDAGRGMTQDQIRDVTAFRQFDRALFEQQGSGLGLVLVKGIVEASGGSLELVSCPGEGTNVRASWPAG